MSSERLRRLLPIGLAAAALIGVWLLAPEVYSGTFSDLGTFLRVVALAAVLVGWTLAMRRFVANPVAARIGAAVPVVVAAWVVLWPYLRPPTEVDEAFPPVVAATEAALVATVDVTTSTADATPSTTSTPSTPTSAPPATAPPTTAPPATAPPPIELRRASFQGLTGHRGSGDAAVYDLGGGSILLRFEGVDIGSGPDLDVYLVPGADQRGTGAGHHVANLTAERGNQNYTVPAGVDLTTGTWTVLVWCETFDVEVANATLV